MGLEMAAELPTAAMTATVTRLPGAQLSPLPNKEGRYWLKAGWNSLIDVTALVVPKFPFACYLNGDREDVVEDGNTRIVKLVGPCFCVRRIGKLALTSTSTRLLGGFDRGPSEVPPVTGRPSAHPTPPGRPVKFSRALTS